MFEMTAVESIEAVPALSGGFVAAVLQGRKVAQPVVQVLNFKASPNNRYRLNISDGIHCLATAMLASQLTPMMENGEIDVYCFCCLKNYNSVKLKDGRTVVNVIELEVLQQSDCQVGNPQPYTAISTQNNDPATTTQAALSVRQDSDQSKPFAGTLGSMQGQTGGLFVLALPTKQTSGTWSNSRGEGRLFSMDLTDEGGEIRATAFTDQCDKFHSLIELNKVYFISRATLKTANKQFTSLRNDYEMTFNSDTTVVPCEGPEADALPGVSFAFIPISELATKQKDTMIDVLGICCSVEEPNKVMVKSTNREVSKRNVELVDQSKTSVRLTIWGADAENFDGSGCPVLAIKGARVSDFNGCSLSLVTSSLMVTNPQLPEAFKLRGWFDREGQTMDAPSISNQRGGGMMGFGSWKTLAQAKLENLGHGEKADYFTVKGTVLFIKKDSCLYQACTQSECRKKVMDLGNGMYRCEKCDRESASFIHRMILQDEPAFDEVFQNANFTSFIFRLRVKLESFNDESRIKATVMEATHINHTVYARHLVDCIPTLP
uniref:Replication protein A subunit n=1 Tax=Eptatretus burgeri TaxID=7764 RepID=A0A8C4N8H0_EPTBU